LRIPIGERINSGERGWVSLGERRRPSGVQAETQVPAGDERRPDGTFAPGARTLQSSGGLTTKATTALARRLGIADLAADSAFASYKRQAVTFRRLKCSELARNVGGGVCGAGPSSIVATAALQLAASRFVFDQAAITGEAKIFAEASRLANDSRQNLMAAHELCAREAEARKVHTDRDEVPVGFVRVEAG
jgi:hypothetical protein